MKVKRAFQISFRPTRTSLFALPFLLSTGCILDIPLQPGMSTATIGSFPSSPGNSATGNGTGATTDQSSDLLSVVIRADSNRDGRIDLRGESDEKNKTVLSREKGALFLANLDDDSGRCKSSSTPQSCNDASDEQVNGDQDAKDLARVKTLPISVSDRAKATLTLNSNKTDAVRIFIESAPGVFSVLKPGQEFDATQIRKGLTFAIEGKEHLLDAKTWDGKITLRYEVIDQDRKGADQVALRIAPLLSHTHAEAIQSVIAAPLATDPNTKTFRRDLEAAVNAAKLPSPPRYLNVAKDEWAQDWVEPFYASMPGPSGPISMHVLIASDQSRNNAYTQLYTLLGPDVGVSRLSQSTDQFIPGRDETFTSFGNLETIPPHPGYPAGRQIVGGTLDKKKGPSAKTMAFLQAQGVQDPIWLDSSWLTVGHVDEFVAFVPTPKSKLGFKIAIIDPNAAVELLKKAKTEGHGAIKLISYKATTDEEKKASGEKAKFEVTIDQFLADRAKLKAQSQAAEHIEANLKILQEKTGVPDADVLRIPGLFREEENLDDELGGLGRAPEKERTMIDELSALRQAHPQIANRYSRLLAALPVHKQVAFFRAKTSARPRSRSGQSSVFIASVPGAINMIVSPTGQVIAPKQFGPVINGKDIFEQSVSKRFMDAGITAHFVDEYVTYHLKGGEVHCGSNTIRKPRSTWWK